MIFRITGVEFVEGGGFVDGAFGFPCRAWITHPLRQVVESYAYELGIQCFLYIILLDLIHDQRWRWGVSLVWKGICGRRIEQRYREHRMYPHGAG